MLIKATTPAKRGMQSEAVMGLCSRGCGCPVVQKPAYPRACDACQLERKRASGRKALGKIRIANGIAPVKGTVFSCSDCSETFVRSGVTNRCPACREKRVLDRARKASAAKSRSRGASKIGEQTACSHCKVAFIRSHPRDKYCHECRCIRERGQLPSYKATQKAGAKRWREERRADPGWRVAEAARLRAKRTRRKRNPAFTLNERMSVMVRRSLASGKQGQSWRELVGFSVFDLAIHLERQFLPGMSWDNRSLWHIDHIVPLASFKFTSVGDPEFRAAWALTNLRPLWKAENLAKNDQRLFLL